MATQEVKVRHNGQVSRFNILVCDETEEGGEEIVRQLAEKLDMPESFRKNLKVVHRGKLLYSKEIATVLQKDPKAVIQVFGATETLSPQPLTVRLEGMWTSTCRTCATGWKSISNSAVGRASHKTYETGIFGRLGRIIWTWLHAMWLFLLTFWPGYDGRRIEGLHTEADPRGGEEDAQPVRFTRRVDTSAQRCRDEINMELVDRGNQGPR